MQNKKPRPARMPTRAFPLFPLTGRHSLQAFPLSGKGSVHGVIAGKRDIRIQDPAWTARWRDGPFTPEYPARAYRWRRFPPLRDFVAHTSPRTFTVHGVKNKKPRCADAHRGFEFFRRARAVNDARSPKQSRGAYVISTKKYPKRSPGLGDFSRPNVAVGAASLRCIAHN